SVRIISLKRSSVFKTSTSLSTEFFMPAKSVNSPKVDDANNPPPLFSSDTNSLAWILYFGMECFKNRYPKLAPTNPHIKNQYQLEMIRPKNRRKTLLSLFLLSKKTSSSQSNLLLAIFVFFYN